MSKNDFFQYQASKLYLLYMMDELLTQLFAHDRH